MNASALQHTSIYQRALDESEESDGEGGLGNLNRLVVRPPGHSGKAKRGHLCFDAAYESGNLGRADYVTELEYDLFVRPDTCRPRSRLWFYFSVDNAKQDQRVIFNFVNFGKEWNLFATEMTPLVRSTSRPKWLRIPRRYVFYHRSMVHRGRRVLSIAFAFDREDDVFQFAVAAPYSYTRLQAHLETWVRRAKESHILHRRELLATTTQKRRVDLLIIGSGASKDERSEKAKANDERKIYIKEEIGGKGKEKQRMVMVIARAHGGEPPASYVCQGFLDFMISSSERARALRQSVQVLVVPMLNPDGVYLGNQRSDLLGADLNRAWNSVSSWAHPALHALRTRIKSIVADKLDFILDLHAHISREGVFMYGNSYDDVYRFERHAVLAKALAARTEAWRGEGCCYNSDARKAGSARRAIAALAPRADSYSLLVSLGGRRLAAHGPYMHYTEDAYIRVGRSLAKSLYDYYHHAGVAAPPGPAAEPRERRRSRRRWRRAGGARSARPAAEHPIEAVAARQCVAQRTLSPPLPPREPQAAALPPAHSLRPARPHAAAKGDTRHLRHEMLTPPIVPEVMGFSMDCARRVRLSVLDVNSSVRERTRAPRASRPRRPRRPQIALPAARPAHTSDDYDTAETADTAPDTDGSY